MGWTERNINRKNGGIGRVVSAIYESKLGRSSVDADCLACRTSPGWWLVRCSCSSWSVVVRKLMGEGGKLNENGLRAFDTAG